MTFVIRASFDVEGQLRGVVLHTQTGRKERFDGAAELGPLITNMAGLPAPAGPALLEGKLP